MARRKVEIPDDIKAIVTDGERRTRQRKMSAKQRAQAKRDAQRTRVSLELDPEVAAMIRAIAEAEGCSMAGVVNLFVVAGVRRYIEGELEFSGQRRVSRSPRYDWVVEMNGAGALREQVTAFLDSRGE